MAVEYCCYATPGKRKAALLCNAFAKGARAKGHTALVYEDAPHKLRPGAAVFYGVVPATRHLFEQAKAEGREWWYIDNSYFDNGRGTYFRVTCNALQAEGTAEPDYARAAALGLSVKPWQLNVGGHVLVLPSSDEFMRLCGWAGGLAGWLARVDHDLRATKRLVKIRPWNRDKQGAASGLPAAMNGAWAVVTHASAAANEALMAGIPTFVTGQCAARPFSVTNICQIESPRYPEGRERWVAALAASQWTLGEIALGAALP